MQRHIRARLDSDDDGFTLIELLVVMIVIGILAAVAVPLFINQRKKAEDAAAKSDVSALGKELATHWIEATAMPLITEDQNTRAYLFDGSTVAHASPNVLYGGSVGDNNLNWCVYVTNPNGKDAIVGYEYSAIAGLRVGTCGL